MTKEEIIEGNKIIGEYMGLSDIKIENNEVVVRIPTMIQWREQFPKGVIKTLSYASDWNELMGVIDKIEEQGQLLVFFEIGDYRMVKFMNRPWNGFGSEKYPNTKIEATFQAVVELIKYVNEKENGI
jgi:hypothetical protein